LGYQAPLTASSVTVEATALMGIVARRHDLRRVDRAEPEVAEIGTEPLGARCPIELRAREVGLEETMVGLRLVVPWGRPTSTALTLAARKNRVLFRVARHPSPHQRMRRGGRPLGGS